MKFDKQEHKKKYQKEFKKVDEILDEEFKGRRHMLGICHLIWARKKQLLKEMYNIDWQSPADLNPGVIFD